MTGQYWLIAAVAYLFGAVPFGFLIGKYYGRDIRREGSGNIGATNVTRVIGRRAGKLCFALDLLKGMLPVLIAQSWIDDPGGAAQLLAGGCAVLGHMFPVYLRFRGGKGISTAAGVAVALAPWAFFFAGLLWVAVFLTSRYVSLASIVAAVALPLAATGLYLWRGGISPLVLAFFYLIGAVAVLKHRSNIARLRNGTEARFERRKK